MDAIQNAWEKTKRTARFVWRHFLTLGVLGILLSVFIEGPLNWKNAFFMVAGAVVLDWAKQFFKLTPRCCHANNPYATSSIQPFRDQWGDPTLRGTAANFLSNMDSDRYN